MCESNKKSDILKYVLLSIWTMILINILEMIGGISGGMLAQLIGKNSSSAMQFALAYAADLPIWIIVILFAYFRKDDRAEIAKLKPKKEKVLFSIGIGLILGLGLNLLDAILAIINGDIKLSFNEFSIGWVLVFILAVVIQSGAEELVGRWFVYERLRRYFPNIPAVAIIGNALLFVVGHFFNAGINITGSIQIFGMGLLTSLVVYYFDSFWMAVVIHTGWNYCQSIILGLPNSGNISEYSIFRLDLESARDSIFYNVGFGIEGTVMADILLFSACALVFYFGRKKKAKQ